MKKNGFTLIELLAVIVILAIIALIATPIILGIINDAREKANERSVELYAAAVKNGIAAYQLTGLNAPKSFSDLTIQYDGDVKCTVQELYEDGSFYLEGCKVNKGTKEYSYGTKQEKVVKLSDVCTIASDSAVQGLNMGAKYNCKVDPNKPTYTFYVLNTPVSGAKSVNLIMDSNIRTGGEAVKESEPTDEQTGLVAWTSESYLAEKGISSDNYWDYNINAYGPVSAMEYLQEATKDWTNTNIQTISTFTDDAGNTYEMAQTFVTNARLPYYSEVAATGCSDSYGSCPLWMVDYLYRDPDLYPNGNSVSRASGYWTLSSSSSSFAPTQTAKSVIFWGSFQDGYVYDYGYIDQNGSVRPVINLSI